MRRILWLLLALSLPAWATINAITSTRILTPCAGGQRDAAYPSGGLCNPPAPVLYHQDFETLSTSQSFAKDANVYGVTPTVSLKEYAGLYWRGNCNDGIHISTDHARETGGSQSLKYYNDFSQYGDASCPGTAKARVEYQLAANTAEFIDCPGVKGDCGDFNFGSERWIGFSVYWPSTGGANAKWGSHPKRPIFFQIFGNGAPTGDGASPIMHFMLDNNGVVDIDTEFSVEAGDLTDDQKYLFTGGFIKDSSGNTLTTETQWSNLKTNGTSNAAYHLKSVYTSASPGQMTRDVWNDFVVHFRKGYLKADGQIEVWLNGAKVLDIPAFPTAPNDFWQGFIKNGLYGGQDVNTGIYTMYLDSYRATDETGDFNAVDPAQDD